MKNLKTFSEFVNESSLNELTHADNNKIKDLLKKLKDKIKNTQLYNDIEDFVRMDILDLHASLDSIKSHILINFPAAARDREIKLALESALTEAINEMAKIKDFSKVKVGDTAEVFDYIGNVWEVIAIGTGKTYDKTLKDYDNSGAMADLYNNLSTYGMSKNDWNNMKMIAVKSKKTGAIGVYSYDLDGAWVNV